METGQALKQSIDLSLLGLQSTTARLLNNWVQLCGKRNGKLQGKWDKKSSSDKRDKEEQWSNEEEPKKKKKQWQTISFYMFFFSFLWVF